MGTDEKPPVPPVAKRELLEASSAHSGNNANDFDSSVPTKADAVRVEGGESKALQRSRLEELEGGRSGPGEGGVPLDLSKHEGKRLEEKETALVDEDGTSLPVGKRPRVPAHQGDASPGNTGKRRDVRGKGKSRSPPAALKNQSRLTSFFQSP